MKLDLVTATAFLRLKAPELDPITRYIRSVHQTTLERLAEVNDEGQLRRLQGRAQLAKELLELVESSNELATKLSRPQQ